MNRIAWIVVAIVCAAMTVWNVRHPVPADWDEANYVNQSCRDVAFAGQGLKPLLRAFVFEDVERPPAYRVVALPVSMLFGCDVRALRALSLLFFLGSCLLLAAAVRDRAGVAVMIFASAAATVAAFVGYGTELTLVFSIALLIHGLFAERTAFRLRFAEVAVAVALGCLSKSTFVIIAGPMIAGVLIAERSLKWLIPVAIGGAIASPWWFWNARAAIAYANWGRIFPRAASSGEWLPRIGAYAFGTIGIGAAVLLLYALISSRLQRRTVVLLCAAAVLPIAAIASPVFVPRHIAPSVVPLAAAIGFMAGERAFRVAVPAIGVQLLLLLSAFVQPGRCLPKPLHDAREPLLPRAAVDWSFLDAPEPWIAYLGSAPGLTAPQIEHAWARRGGAHVTWLWRFEEGDIRLAEVEEAALQSDVVIIVEPSSIPRPCDARTRAVFAIENRHNLALAAWLGSRPEFAPPELRTIAGGSSASRVMIFIRRAPAGDREKIRRLEREQLRRILG